MTAGDAAEVNSLASLTARVGHTWGRALFYVKGGLAAGEATKQINRPPSCSKKAISRTCELVVRHLRHPDRADRIRYGRSLGSQNNNLPQLQNDLFRLVLLRHCSPYTRVIGASRPHVRLETLEGLSDSP